MEKIDFKKQYKECYNPPTNRVVQIDVPKANFLMIDGKGDPDTSPEYKAAIEALYPLAYTIKFDFKKNQGIDFGVMPLEGLWWAEDMNDFITQKKENWQWTMMIMQPEFVTKKIFEKNKLIVKSKKNPASIDNIRLENYDEGKCVQIMNIGPFAEEGPYIQKTHDYIKEIGGKIQGKHHEIYLSDFRWVDPAKMKTVLRQPYSLLASSKS